MIHESKSFLTFAEAKSFVHRLEISNYDEWREYRASGKRPAFIPSDPYRTYKGEWISWGEWLGNGNIHGCKRKYVINDDFFNTWTKDMAYILGFWWADGFITEKNFSITQHKSDKYILEKILEKMSSNYPIYFHCRNNFRFFIKSEKLVQDIKNLGGTTQKRLRESFPEHIPSNFVSHFVRGFFDGDGSVVIDKKTNGVTSSFSSGSILFLNKLSETIKSHIDSVNPHIYKVTAKKGIKVCEGFLNKDSLNYRLVMFKKDSFALYKFMYEDAELYLNRKKRKYEEVFS